MSIQLICFPDGALRARALAAALGAECAPLELHRFPDGESRLCLPELTADHVIVHRSLDRPNEKLLELMLCARALRERGVERLTLVAPYLCYMRQDASFHRGEVVSQRIVGEFIDALFDAIVTVDPHLHRIERLEQAIPRARCAVVSACAAIAAHLRVQAPDALLIGPDAESLQWVREVARHAGAEFAVATKIRYGDRDVSVELPEVAIRGRPVVLVDDIASSGQTLARAAALCRDAGAMRIDAVVTHALCDDDAIASLAHSGVGRLWSSDTVEHPTNAIEVTDALAAGVRSLA